MTTSQSPDDISVRQNTRPHQILTALRVRQHLPQIRCWFWGTLGSRIGRVDGFIRRPAGSWGCMGRSHWHVVSSAIDSRCGETTKWGGLEAFPVPGASGWDSFGGRREGPVVLAASHSIARVYY